MAKDVSFHHTELALSAVLVEIEKKTRVKRKLPENSLVVLEIRFWLVSHEQIKNRSGTIWSVIYLA